MTSPATTERTLRRYTHVPTTRAPMLAITLNLLVVRTAIVSADTKINTPTEARIRLSLGQTMPSARTQNGTIGAQYETNVRRTRFVAAGKHMNCSTRDTTASDAVAGKSLSTT